MAILRCLACLLALLVMGGAALSAERRVALVLGNAAYVNVPALTNPVNDAKAIRAQLEKLGFEVFGGVDLSKMDTQATMAQFAKAVRGADIAAFYYAGHGLQVDGRNYLLPVDAKLEDETSLDFEAVSIDFILRQMSRETALRLVFLDACRDNPLAKVMAKSGSSTGLAEIEIENDGAGTLVAFATSPNEVAYDGKGDHSPFSAAILAHIATENVPLTTIMTRVTGDVFKATGGKQRPWVNLSLTDEIILNKVAAPEPPPVVASAEPGQDVQSSTRTAGADEATQLALSLLRQQIPDIETEGPILFDQPIQFGDPAIDGKSISQLIQGKPLFSPIEGLDKAAWDTQCTSCHQWNQARLCEQSSNYDKVDVSVLRLPHPYGTRFKVALAHWAKNGCK